MTAATPLQKRIKRHLTGRKHRFFAATAPGLEGVCRDELKSFLPAGASVAAVEGGAEFDARLHDGYLANMHLRTANRILMRIRSFYAVNFRQLEKNLKDIQWELYLHPGAHTRIHATSRQSRLYHKAAVAQRIQESICARLAEYRILEATCPEPARIQRIFARASRNEVVVSIDSSGELLHKRGIKPNAARAPLRETIAAAALILAGYTGAEPLVDPMCGSGSFALEAALMAQRIPPGWYRDFAFMNWPAFQPARWRHLRRQAEMNFRPIAAPLIFASDRDEQAVAALGENLIRQGLAHVVSATARNFFDFSPQVLTNRRGVVALNPPFGRRMGSRQDSDVLFSAVCRRLSTQYRGWKFALIAPRPALVQKVPFHSSIHFLPLGGIRVALLTGTIP